MGKKIMEQQSCIFCAILANKIPATIIDEDDFTLVVKDINPKAPIHYLIITKKHISDVASVTLQDAHYTQAIMMMANKLSKKLSGSQNFRLITNNGLDAGQSVFHLHSHFLSGKKMSDSFD